MSAFVAEPNVSPFWNTESAKLIQQACFPAFLLLSQNHASFTICNLFLRKPSEDEISLNRI